MLQKSKFFIIVLFNVLDVKHYLKDMYIRYLFQQISKFLEDSMDVFYGIRTLKSIDYSKNNWF